MPATPVGVELRRPDSPRKPEATALFWRGRATYDSDSGGNMTEGTTLSALRSLQQAVSVDPSFAQAHAGVAIASTDLAPSRA